MRLYYFLGLVGAILSPLRAFAHEVYVLDKETIVAAMSTPRFSLLDTLTSNIGDFLFWACIAVSSVIVIFLFSISRFVERKFCPLLEKGYPFAPLVARISLGLSFIAAAYFQASYGPELPLADTFGILTQLATSVLVLIGVCITMGVFVRFAAVIALLYYIASFIVYGSYILTYASYFGIITLLLIFGAHRLDVLPSTTISKKGFLRLYGKIADKLSPYGFLILRVSFGISLVYSAIYAKFIHNNLALAVAANPLAGHLHGVAHYLGFEPQFLVLGAGIIELGAGILFILGIETRFLALFIEFWLGLSLLYFGESVWPHIILIGLPITFFLYGYDKYSLEGRFFKKGKLQPVL